MDDMDDMDFLENELEGIRKSIEEAQNILDYWLRAEKATLSDIDSLCADKE